MNRTTDDLILRAAAIEALYDERVDRYYGDVNPESVERLIESIPAVDAAPVVHGRWIFHEENGPMGIWLTCSVCGKESGVHEGNYYCHWCGAKMETKNEQSM